MGEQQSATLAVWRPVGALLLRQRARGGRDGEQGCCCTNAVAGRCRRGKTLQRTLDFRLHTVAQVEEPHGGEGKGQQSGSFLWTDLMGNRGRSTSCRDFDPGYIEEFVTPPNSLPALPPPSSSSSSTPQHTASLSSNRSRPRSAVQLRIKSRRSEPASRPHSWHSAKLSECQQEMEQRAVDTMSGAWPHSYHASASTTNLCGGFDSGEGYLRKSPDQYSSRGSMESLDPPQSSQFHSVAQRQHPVELHGHSASQSTYSSCQQLSSARSSSSIDHLHSKRDSAYSSFSTSSSIPEYFASTPSFSPERCYSLETVPQRAGGSAEMLQADMRCVRSVQDDQQGLCQEPELSSGSASTLGSSNSRAGLKPGLGREVGVCYRGNSSSTSGNNSGGIPAWNRHSVGPIWGPTISHSSSESLKGAPAPPRRSDSFAAIRNHERPNSWSSLENARSLRSLQKGSWHHSSGPVAPVSAKGSYGMEGQLHTVIEKSPESSPTTKPRQGGGFLQPPSPTRPSASPTPQPARTVLPTSVFPVAQPEPHYAHMPSSGPGPGLCGVEESSQGLQSATPTVEGPPETRTEERNSHPTSLFPHPPYPPPASAQLRTQTMEANRHQEQDSSSGSCRPNKDSTGQEPQGLNGLQGPDGWGPHIQSFQESQSQTSQGPPPEQGQDVSISQVHSGASHKSIFTQERKSHHAPLYSWGDQNRPVEQSSTPPQPVSSPRLAQGQPSSRHFSDSAAPRYQHWDHRELDRDNPLTRLEIALAEVQRCASPDAPFSGSNHDNSNVSDVIQGPARSLSVLEKVSRFERRECGGRQRSLSTNVSLNRAAQLRAPEKGRSSPCGADDLRSMLERSTKGTKAHRTMSYRGGSGDYVRSRTPADPMSALQRSRSSFQLDGSNETETNKDFPWRQDIQEAKAPLQDASSNRCSRDVLKEAPTAALWNPSMKQWNLSAPSSAHPSAAPPTVSSSSSQLSSVPAKCPSLEKKGPKTMPKPQGIVITPQSPPPLTSPHTPKERHAVSPDVPGPSPPALPRVPPVGLPALMRICGRRRLTADQKKRSYSEPENMNEVGVSDSETAGLFRRGGDSWLPETSVADRRKMFELAARHGGSQASPSRSDLRQAQQDALAEYVERKRGAKRGGAEGQRGGPRPHSVYLQPEYSGHTDTISLSSASSLLSLQEFGPDSNFPSGERGFCSILPPGADLRGLQSNFFYPGRVTSPRPPAQPPSSASTDSTLDLSSEGDVSRQSHFRSRDPNPGRHRPTAGPQSALEYPRQPNGALGRAGPSRRPGKSASAEDLLERLETKPSTLHHHRSRSSPASETLTQSFPQDGVRMFGVSFTESGRCPLAADSLPLRPADIPPAAQLPSGRTAQSSENLLQPVGPPQDPFHTPVPRRDRPRNTERPRAQSASMLAASVGLPCPFSPQDTAVCPEWKASDRLSRANLEAISFPDIPHSSRGVGSGSEALQADRQSRHSLSDAAVLEETTKDVYRSRAFSLDTRGTHPKPVPAASSSAFPHSQISTNRNPSGSTASPPASPLPRHLSSLRISESSLCSPVSQQPLETSSASLKADLDEVFLHSPPPPPPPPPSPPPFQEITIPEDFPPPPPLLEFKQEVQQHSEQSVTSSPQSSAVSLLPSPKPPPPFIPAEEELTYEPVPRREETGEELRAQALARQLVLQEPSLARLLDPWRGKSTVELMEEIFPNSPLTDQSQQQSRRGSCVDGGTREPLCSQKDPDRETDLDEEERDLHTLKVELCEVLRNSVVALQQEKEALCEEQRGHKALGASIEELVQERLKTNEKDKYSMFIGDLERIVNLLLSLCSRLSRIDRSLLALEREELMMEDVAKERDSLHHKRSLLLRQTEDARELKENLDRRQRVVHAILSSYLTEAQLQDYRRYVSTKPSLLIRLRHLDELVRLREQQLAHLNESAWPTDRLLPSPAPAPPLTVAGPAHSLRSTAVTSL
ncbi:protein Shroom3 isoform X4 [Oryzias latipes]|uniref:protein Shroom3 isoform X4 n=1 Tax=Oryzias latipes TaxID=8090 RepID=UPI000CE2516D|nr:protein Shroom3 isoform X4 [Oryzias latipes]